MPPLTGHHIRLYLSEVADAMEPIGPQHTLILVGGSLLAWHGLREGNLRRPLREPSTTGGRLVEWQRTNVGRGRGAPRSSW